MAKAETFLGKRRLVNHKITEHIIFLHRIGYVLDFRLGINNGLTCDQEEYLSVCTDCMIDVIDQYFDQLSNSYKYIHTIETSTGKKGLLLNENLITVQLLNSTTSGSFEH